ncbi:hypothetical protein ACFX4I_25130 [Peribacillus sp. YIM B13472]|uniref:hypothetical protein n=1 Tax=Peribacillus sp. YIM B13472 TaxID=3366297 RepID=UPI0036707F58
MTCLMIAFKRPPIGGLLMALTHPLAIHEAQKISVSPQRMKIGLYVDNVLIAGEEGL